MPRLVVVVALSCLLAACKGPPPPPDEALATKLRQVIAGTLVDMGVAPERRPQGRALDEQARLLAFQCDAGVVAAINDGSLSARDVRADADRVVADFNAQSHGPTAGMKLPLMFAWLHQRAETLPRGRLLLLHALTRQAARGFNADGRTR